MLNKSERHIGSQHRLLCKKTTKNLIGMHIFNNRGDYRGIFAEGKVIIGEYSPRRSRGEYSPIITEPDANNCFSIFTQSFVFLGLNLY